MDSIRNKNNLRGTPPDKLPNSLPDSYLTVSKDKLPDVTCISRREWIVEGIENMLPDTCMVLKTIHNSYQTTENDKYYL